MKGQGTLPLIRLVGSIAISISAVARLHSAEFAPMLGTLNGPDYLVSIDRDTGVGTRIGPLGIGFDDAMTALEYDAINHVLYGAVSANITGLFEVNPLTGAATRIGDPDSLGILATGMAHDSINDILYAAGGDRFFRKNLYTIDRNSGESQLLGPVAGVNDSLQGLAFDPRPMTLYGLDEFLNTGARIIKIDPQTLTSSPITGTISDENGWNGLAFDPFTGFIYASANLRLYRINPSDGSIVSSVPILAPDNHTVGALTVMSPYVVPEPSPIWLLGAAIVLSTPNLRRKLLRCRQ
jgi:hypothetical protein